MPGPLQQTRVVELAGLGPAPFAAMLLADLGAEVVRVDRAGAPSGLFPPEYDLLNRGKRSVAVDLKHADGPATVLELAERADIVLEGYRPGVAERLGIGPQPCLQRNPQLIYGRMTGWGQQGPRAGEAGHDLTYLGLTGVVGSIGAAEHPPRALPPYIGDFGGGANYLVIGVLAALLNVRAGGQGQVVDASIVDGSAHLSTILHGLLAGGLWQDRRGANLLDSGAPFYDVYRCADGEYVAVGALEPKFYAQLVSELELSDAPEQYDMHQWPRLRELLTQRFAERSRDEWVSQFAGSDACVGPVHSLREAQRDQHLRARETFVEHEGVTQPAPAPRFTATPAELTTGPALPGQHSADVLQDWKIPNAEQRIASGAVMSQE